MIDSIDTHYSLSLTYTKPLANEKVKKIEKIAIIRASPIPVPTGGTKFDNQLHKTLASKVQMAFRELQRETDFKVFSPHHYLTRLIVVRVRERGSHRIATATIWQLAVTD